MDLGRQKTIAFEIFKLYISDTLKDKPGAAPLAEYIVNSFGSRGRKLFDDRELRQFAKAITEDVANFQKRKKLH